MSKSEHLTAAHELAVVRLVNECCELGDDAPAWQAHFLAGLRGLTDALVVATGPLPGVSRYAVTVAELGWPSEAVRLKWHHWERDPRNIAEHPTLMGFLHAPGTTLTRTRRQLAPDREWERDAFARDRLRPDGIDEAILARVSAGAAGLVYTTTVMRPAASRAYSARDGRLVERLHAELEPHLGRALLVTTQPNLHGLSPRRRQVLAALLDGDSEKQVALRLGISPATVHDHVKALHRHFGVATRAELLAYFLRRYRPRPADPA